MQFLARVALSTSESTRSEARSLLQYPQPEATLRNFSASARSTQACSTVRCRRWSWLAVSGTSPIFSAVRRCARSSSPPRRSLLDVEAKPQFSQRSAVALVPARPTSPTRRSLLAPTPTRRANPVFFPPPSDTNLLTIIILFLGTIVVINKIVNTITMIMMTLPLLGLALLSSGKGWPFFLLLGNWQGQLPS